MPRKVPCWNNCDEGKIKRRDLDPLERGAVGIPQTEDCPVCDGRGWLWED